LINNDTPKKLKKKTCTDKNNGRVHSPLQQQFILFPARVACSVAADGTLVPGGSQKRDHFAFQNSNFWDFSGTTSLGT
jgi:hypothetical protein